MYRVARRSLAVALGLAAVTCGLAVPAQAGEDTGLCSANRTRVTIPGSFPLDACFDGSTLTFKNNTDFPLTLTFVGDDVGNPQRFTRGGEGAARVLEFIQPGPFARQPQINGPSYRSGLVPPKYFVTAPIGSGKVEVRVAVDTAARKQYVAAKLLWDFLPARVAIEVIKVLAELVRELLDIDNEYQVCLKRNTNAWGDLGCSVLLGRNVVFAFGRAAIAGLGGAAIKAVTAAITSNKWALTSISDNAAIQKGVKVFTIAAYQEPAKPTTKAPDPPVIVEPPIVNPPQVPVVQTAVVQNKHLEGATGLAEDSTPAYLSTQMQPFCGSRGCKIGGTDMWSGATFEALCWSTGALMTNENRNIPGDDNNPHRIDSYNWLRGRVNGHEGWISYIYLTPASRNLNVQHC